MKKDAQLATWLDSEEFHRKLQTTFILSGDVMYTRVYPGTPGKIKLFAPYFSGEIEGRSVSSLGNQERMAFELGKALREVAISSHWGSSSIIQTEFARRSKSSPDRAPAEGNYFAREDWGAESAVEVERRMWWLEVYLGQCPWARQPHLVRRLSDERLLDVILWEKFRAPGPGITAGQ